MTKLFLFTALLAGFTMHPANGFSADIDLSRGVIAVPAELTSREQEAIRLLQDEVYQRTLIRWIQMSENGDASARIAIGRIEAIRTMGYVSPNPSFDVSKAEGYQIWCETRDDHSAVVVAGNDERGVLFGVGGLLRGLKMSPHMVAMSRDFQRSTYPAYPLRGHQLGYRPKANSYDGWTLDQFEQYIRDLIVFGSNAIELIPPRSDDKDTSPHFPLPQMETMIGLSDICDRYGIDLWIWYPAMDKDYSDPGTVEFALNEWGEVFRKLPRVDAVFVPCGDPGHTPPEILFPMLEKQAEQLKRIHPNAEWWIGPQGFDPTQMRVFHDLISENPAWLTGIVYGPWIRMTLPEFKQWIPSRYPIRHYPDITHTTYCQFPVPDWDPAFYLTEGREIINPRPMDHAHIFKTYQPGTIGFITYSEGCNDDVNKFIWSGLGWDPSAKVIDLLREYCRYLIGPSYEDDFAQGLLALERNWQGPVLTNSQIDRTLQQFQDMEQSASPSTLSNWRFLQGLFRAYYDAYVRRRLLLETSLENQALSVLRQAPLLGSLIAMERSTAILLQAVTKPVAVASRQRIFELNDSLFQTIRMQMLTERYQAGRPDGAVLDRIDTPLNNRLWLLDRFQTIQRLQTEKERLAEIDRIVQWKNPGPGGFYDDLGQPSDQPRLLVGKGFHDDPTLYATIRNNPDHSALSDPFAVLPLSWKTMAVTLYDHPIQMRYEALDPHGEYTIRVVYADGPVKLTADESIEVHSFIDSRYEILEFDIPKNATMDGTLLLTWSKPIGIQHSGRRNEICEAWLVKK